MVKRGLKREHLIDPRVERFYCGALDRDRDIVEFLRYDAIDKVESGDLSVWLYFENADVDARLIGFTSLGKTKWSYPKENSRDKVPIQIIPNLALAVEFHRERDASGDKFSNLIMDDVIAEALERRSYSDLLGLYVHVENLAARALYHQKDFEDYGKVREQLHGPHQRMLLDLRNDV